MKDMSTNFRSPVKWRNLSITVFLFLVSLLLIGELRLLLLQGLLHTSPSRTCTRRTSAFRAPWSVFLPGTAPAGLSTGLRLRSSLPFPQHLSVLPCSGKQDLEIQKRLRTTGIQRVLISQHVKWENSRVKE